MSVKEVTLIKVDANANNNKFYRLIMDIDGRISATWGRVGVTSPQSTTYVGGEKKFDSIVRSKEKKGYRVTGVVSVTKDSSSKVLLKDVANSTLAKGSQDSALTSAISYMVDCNRHEIIKASGGLLKVDDSGVVKTPLGIVSDSSIVSASKILDDVALSTSSVNTKKLTSDYLTLIPQKVIGRDWAETFFNESSKITEQKNLLRQLRSSLDWYESQQGTDDDSEADLSKFQDLFSIKLERVSDVSVLSDISRYYNKTMNKMHTASYLSIKNVFELNYSDAVNEEFDQIAQSLGNRKLLWHGTDAGNVLSILREGLYCPPVNDAKFKTNGRMFGDNSIYLSDMSTKSLNYSFGYWSGQRNDRCFMFLADVVMGNEYWPNRDKESGYQFNVNKAYFGTDDNGKKFDSISVKAGTCGVRNNEMMVWNTKQVKLKYLIEFNK